MLPKIFLNLIEQLKFTFYSTGTRPLFTCLFLSLLNNLRAESLPGLNLRWSTQLDLIRQQQIERPEISYSALRPGFSVAGSDFGVWGHYENILSDQKGFQKGYNIAAMKSLFFNQSWLNALSFSGFFGQNSSYYFRPSKTYGLSLNLQIVPSSTLIFAFSQDLFITELTRNQYQYNKVSLIQNLYTSLRLWLTVQLIKQNLAQPAIEKLGNNHSILLEYIPNTEQTMLFGYNASCLSNQFLCINQPEDSYLELNFNFKQRIPLSQENYQWWFNVQFSSIFQTSHFNRVIWNGALPKDSITYHAIFGLLGSSFTF